MGQLLTANVATSMYWLGRYLERIEETLHEINKAYDKIIDVDKDAGVKIYKKFHIDLEYTNAIDFLEKAIRGDHSANLIDILKNARENAIISREYIDELAFGEIIELNEVAQRISKSTEKIDYKDIDYALSLISEIWGAQTKRGHRKVGDYFLKLGKLVEEVDFRLRFGRNQAMTDVVLEEINTIFKLFNPELEIKISENEDIMDSIYKQMDKLIVN
ncbi:A predicted alpha-helical domain with a conserved ER motif [Epsilonproteobacteria bacterium SCGC AD-308-O04]|jgi:uncharacterized alpha-E superfamily protein|nr:A predicted alpha-helical domain with a conserved ER motif [Epsilonproteobacteria bacterium SCGC AD-308-O04]